MSGKTGEPKDGNTMPAGQENCRTETNRCGEKPDMQDETVNEILTTLNQKNLQNTFDEKDTAEGDGMDKFSQAFMDNMRAMVAERFGEDAADRFMVQNKDMIKQETTTSVVPDTEKRLSQANPAASEHEEPVPFAARHPETPEKTESVQPASTKKPAYRKWAWRAAALLVFVLAGLGAHRAGRVSATKLPAVNTAPETTVDYSKIGSLKDIISTLDYTSFPQEIKQVYVPGVVADGYEEISREEVTKSVNVYYENIDNTGWYQYCQMTVDNNTFLDTEEGDWVSVEIGEYPGLYAFKDGSSNLWWFDYTYIYQLQGNLSEDEMKAVAESLILEK